MGVLYTIEASWVYLRATGGWPWIYDPSVEREPNPYERLVRFGLDRPTWQHPRALTFTDDVAPAPEACLSARLVRLLAERADAAMGLLGATEPALRDAIGHRHLCSLAFDAATGRLTVALDEYIGHTFFRRELGIEPDGAVALRVRDGEEVAGEAPSLDPALAPLLAELRRGLAEILPPAGVEL